MNQPVGPSDLTLTMLQPSPELFETPAAELLQLLDGPTLVDINGRGQDTVFVSVLLHGNETSGWNAVCDALRTAPQPGNNVCLLIGNPHAAAECVRSLPGQADHNRIWRNHDGAERRFVDRVLMEVARRAPFVAVDFHNNTGRNPHYSVLTNLDEATLELASAFSSNAVLVEEPDTVITRATAELCPSIAVEVGGVGDPASDARALTFMQTLMSLDAPPAGAAHEVAVYRSIARVHIAPEVQFGFSGESDALNLNANIEASNFAELPAGTVFGTTSESANPIYALSPEHVDVTEDFFEARGNDIVLHRAATPAMYTTDADVIRQDCLCYLMEKSD